jgi:hypothetical protein
MDVYRGSLGAGPIRGWCVAAMENVEGSNEMVHGVLVVGVKLTLGLLEGILDGMDWMDAGTTVGSRRQKEHVRYTGPVGAARPPLNVEPCPMSDPNTANFDGCVCTLFGSFSQPNGSVIAGVASLFYCSYLHHFFLSMLAAVCISFNSTK